MLPIHIKEQELWDEANEVFYNIEACDLLLEHSLLSVSLWEAKYHKAYLTSEKTAEEVLDYIKMMVVGEYPDDDFVFMMLTKQQLEEIGKYINDPMTATTFTKEDEDTINGKINKDKFTTSEEIYSWMAMQSIPFECERWHLNRLITLIKICAINNKPKDKKKKRMTQSDLVARRARMEAARKKYGG